MKRLVISFAVALIAAVIYSEFGIHTMLSAILAVIVHELGHIAVLVGSGLKIEKIKIEPSGVKIEYTGIANRIYELCSALAGPLAGIVFWAVALSGSEFMQMSGRFSLIYSLFNLLPLIPLDGSRIFWGIASNYIGEECAAKHIKTLSLILSIIFFCIGLLFLLKGEGGGMFAAGIWLLIFQRDN